VSAYRDVGLSAVIPSSNSLIRCVPALRRSPRRGLFSTSDRGPPEPGVPRGRTTLAAWHTLRGGEADEHADSCGCPRRPARAAPGGVPGLRGEVAAGDPGPLGPRPTAWRSMTSSIARDRQRRRIRVRVGLAEQHLQAFRVAVDPAPAAAPQAAEGTCRSRVKASRTRQLLARSLVAQLPNSPPTPSDRLAESLESTTCVIPPL
jgi:hypothetical protein